METIRVIGDTCRRTSAQAIAGVVARGRAIRVYRLVLVSMLALSTVPAALISSTHTAGASGGYAFIDLGTLPGGGSGAAKAINNAGQIVGDGYTSDSCTNFPCSRAFLWQNGVMQDLGTMSGGNSYGMAINAAGVVAGQSDGVAVRWQGGTYTNLDPAGMGSWAVAINNATPIQVAGQINTANAAHHAALWTGTSLTDLGTLGGINSQATGINDSGQVVGYSDASGTTASEPFVWRNGTMTQLPTLGGPGAMADAVNNAGIVVGSSDVVVYGVSGDHAVYWQNGSPTDLGGATYYSGATAINNASPAEIVGWADDASGNRRAVIFGQNGALTPIDTNVPANIGWQITDATGVDDAGDIVGFGNAGDGNPHGYLLTKTIQAAATFDPPELQYNSSVGTASTAQTATVVNTGNANLTINSIGLAGANASDFTTGSDTCTGATLFPGNSCSVHVSFVPAAAGSRYASLTLNDNAPTSPNAAPLYGYATVPVATLSPTNLDFGSQTAGTNSASQTITVSSTGTGALTFGANPITITGANAADFSQTNTCANATLYARAYSTQPYNTCTVTVTFEPSGPGSRTATLSVADNAADSPQQVSLSGTGLAPAVALSTTSLSFGNQNVNSTSAGKTVTVTNTGTAQLTFATVPLAISGSNASDFAQTNTCGNTLDPGTSCTVSVTFTPTAAGSRSATLSINDTAANSPQQVALSGFGLSADLGIGIKPSSTRVKNGTALTYSITVTNAGPGSASGVTMVDPLPTGETPSSTSAGCSVSGSTATCALGTLASGASATVSITVKVKTTSSSIANTASVNSSTYDPNTANNTASSTVSVYGK